MKRVIPVTLAGILLTSCAQLATIRNVEPPAPSVASVSGRSFPTERASSQDPEAALAHDLGTAATAWADLGRDPSDGGAVQDRIVSLQISPPCVITEARKISFIRSRRNIFASLSQKCSMKAPRLLEYISLALAATRLGRLV